MKISEDSILKSIRSGDQQAFERLFDTYWEVLFQYAFGILEDEHEAEDLVQELFMEIWESRVIISPIRTDWKTYLFSCLKKKVLKTFRSQGIRRRHLDHLIHKVGSVELPIKDFLHDELVKSIHLQLETLPEREKRVFILHEIEGYSVKEISFHHAVSEQTVRNQIAAATKKMHPYITRLLTSCFLFTPIAKLMLIRIFQ
ncbi:RNA polymerase sigma factor [Anditalea andensis]|uniref:RNA polymerase n=1 Tax=Anditalea andensis TaxID=1048983 RepID=A0A074L6N4_9BACT|nr:sigma-70 family RNA polymerase sigma factor [Anditalea andensis]KEO75493.1 hypothetical protein EL17_01200 [Anditalea andensis]